MRRPPAGGSANSSRGAGSMGSARLRVGTAFASGDQVQQSEHTVTIREADLMAAGAAAVMDAVRTDHAQLHLAPLGQACSRAARGAATFGEALAWTDATVAVYEAEAAALSDPMLRNGRDIIAYGLRAALVLRFGVGCESLRTHLEAVEGWVREAVVRVPMPSRLMNYSADDPWEQREPLIIAQERLQAVFPLWQQRLLPPDLDEWFIAVAADGT